MIDKIADTVLQTDITIDFDIRPVSRLHSLMQRVGVMPKKDKYVLKPITMGSLIKISKLLIEIDMNLFDMKNFLESSYQAIVKHGETAARVVAIAIHGRPGEVPEQLVESVLNNFTTKELQATMSVILGQMNVQDFMLSIISIKGMNVIQMSQQLQEEIIAPGQLSAVS